MSEPSAEDIQQADNWARALGCGLCGDEPAGLASITIGDQTRYYCHGDDDEGTTCYEKAQWEMSGIRPDALLLENWTREEWDSLDPWEGF